MLEQFCRVKEEKKSLWIVCYINRQEMTTSQRPALLTGARSWQADGIWAFIIHMIIWKLGCFTAVHRHSATPGTGNGTRNMLAPRARAGTIGNWARAELIIGIVSRLDDDSSDREVAGC